jgi:hypothetical protein
MRGYLIGYILYWLVWLALGIAAIKGLILIAFYIKKAIRIQKTTEDNIGFNYLDTIEKVKNLFRESGNSEFEEMILNAQLEGGTAGERLMIVCSRLMWIKQHHPKIYLTAKLEADQLIKFARQSGLEPIPK